MSHELIQIREYATLSTRNDKAVSIDHALISEETFEWLLSLQEAEDDSQQFFKIVDKYTLKVSNFVGYLESPQGQGIEILPKTEFEYIGEVSSLRLTLQKMLSASFDLKPAEIDHASLKTVPEPIHEWVMGQFLKALSDLVRKGLRFEYLQYEGVETVVRGQIDMSKQLRQTPDKAAHFNLRYTKYSPEGVENRLLKTALNYVLKKTGSSENWRLANMLSHQLTAVPELKKPLSYLTQWRNNKQFTNYKVVKPWCMTILEKLNPNFQFGEKRGIALLFPMERLFENYVGQYLKTVVSPTYFLRTQASSEYLLKHQPEDADSLHDWFLLKPDFLIQNNNTTLVLDAKWKMISSIKNSSQYKYDISQSDLYQMFAYGQKYLNGAGNLILIYPQNKYFDKPLPAFHFSKSLKLYCVPFDIEQYHITLSDSLNNLVELSINSLN